jgi:two-component sensor histidine kinase
MTISMTSFFCFKRGFFFLLLFICIHASAQTGGWKTRLDTISDKTAKVEYLLKFTKQQEYKAEVMDAMQLALQLAKETGNDSLIATANFHLGAHYLLVNDLNTSSGYLQKAKVLFLRNRLYNNAVLVVYWQAKILVQTRQSDSLLKFLDKNELLMRLSNNARQKLNVELMYGIAYMMLNKDDEARTAYMELLPKAEAQKDTELVVSLCMNIGQLQHTFDSSMLWYNKVLSITKESDLPKYADLLAGIAWEYSQRDDAKKDSALYYYQEAEKYLDYMEMPMSRMILYNNTGEFFFQKGEFKMALPYFHKAVKYGKQAGIVLSIPYNNLALSFLAMRKLDSAAHYRNIFGKAVSKSEDDYEWMLYYQLNVMYAKAKGDSCSAYVLSNYEKTIAYAVKLKNTRHSTELFVTDVTNCLVGQKHTNSPEIKIIAQKLLVHCKVIYDMVKAENKLINFSAFLERYAILEELYGDKIQALALYKEIVTIENEINEKKYTKGVEETMVKYKTDLKDAEILLLTQKEETGRIRTNFILAGMGALALIIVLIFTLYRRENKNKHELDIRNKKVEELLREIHHRVKNNLQIVSSFINIQLDKVKDSESVEALKDTSRRIMALAGLHHSLYRQDDFSNIQLDEYIEELGKNIQSSMQHTNHVEIRYDLEKLQLDMDKAIPIGLALNELITNALKHAFEVTQQHSKIIISLHHKNNWELIVKDNGKGLPREFQDSHKKSIGLRLVQNLIQRQVKGTFSYFNDQGAVFKIEFQYKAA